jgi:signal transduction histidine kinase
MWNFGKPSLVRRLVVLAGIWNLVVLVVAGVFLTAQFRDAAIRRFDQSLAVLTDDLYAGSSIEAGVLKAPFLTDIRATRAYSGRYWTIFDQPPGGGGLNVIERSRSLFDSDLVIPAEQSERLMAEPGKTHYFDLKGPQNRPLRAAALLAQLPGYPRPVVFIAAEDRSPIDADADRFARITAFALVILGGGLIAAVLVQVRVGLQPLFRLRREVASVRRGRTEKLEGAYPEELEPLAVELNALLTHNQEVVERQRTHVGNLAHALKTPLSVMLTEAGQRPGPLSEVVARQAATMREQVDHHLRRARPAPAPRPRANARRSSRSSTSWPSPWSGSSRTRAWRSIGGVRRTCASRASARTSWSWPATSWKTPASGARPRSASRPSPARPSR